MKIHRRDFLKLSGAGALAATSPALPWPHPAHGLHAGHGLHVGHTRAAGTTLVVVYLRGGQDPLNTIVPYGVERYYEIRPTIAIPRPGGQEPGGVIPLDTGFGLHPALAPLKPLWDAKLFAPILNVGSPHPTRSHFDAQDFMEYAAPGLRTVRSGWLNRYLQLTADPDGKEPVLRALAMQGLLPRGLRGDYPVLAVPDMPPMRDGGVLDAFERLYGQPKPAMADDEKGRRAEDARHDAVKATGRATIRALRHYHEVQGRKTRTPAGVAYPRSRFGSKLQRIAKVIKAGEPLDVACADYTGWDHHANEGGSEGTLARKLADLSAALAAFMSDIGDHAERTVVLTMTEFGRTCRENGNGGTDHGHGGLMFALGGPVRGGEIHGRWRGLDDKHLYQGRDLQATTDFRDVMAEVLVAHLGVKLPRGFFPEYRPGKHLGFLG